jgi:hypothetical protein
MSDPINKGYKFSVWKGSINISKLYFIYQAINEKTQINTYIMEQIKKVHFASNSYLLNSNYKG